MKENCDFRCIQEITNTICALELLPLDPEQQSNLFNWRKINIIVNHILDCNVR